MVVGILLCIEPIRTFTEHSLGNFIASDACSMHEQAAVLKVQLVAIILLKNKTKNYTSEAGKLYSV